LAGGGPANVMVLYNGEDPEAESVAEHYESVRQLLPGRLCPLWNIDPTSASLDASEYEFQILEPFEACLEALPDPDEIDYVVLVRGLPYRVDLPSYSASLQATLQLMRSETIEGVQLAGQGQNGSSPFVENPHQIEPDLRGDDYTVTNEYSGYYTTATGIVHGNELPSSFRRTGAVRILNGQIFDDNLLIVTRLDGFDYQDAHDLIDRAVAADGSFPTAEILCMAASDSARGARDPECEYAVRHLKLAGMNAVWVESFDATLSNHEIAAYFTGSADLRDAIDGQTYVPGAIAGNLTSYGAVPENWTCTADGLTCPESESQTAIARFVRAGATGVHGTVAEPYNAFFPQAGTLLLYTHGYNLGESWFFNQWVLYWQNVYIGDPLTSPWAERPVPAVPDTVVEGEQLVIGGVHAHGIASVRVYLDGSLIAQEDAETLALDLGLAPGDTVELFVVVVAENVAIERKGWDQPDQFPRPDVQGWAWQTVTITQAQGDSSVPSDTGQTPVQAECGCVAKQTPGSTGWLLGLTGLLVRRQRRNGHLCRRC
jgi:uncharacterized protein (TIGR03790 family)